MISETTTATSLRALAEVGRRAVGDVGVSALVSRVAQTTCEALGYKTAVVNLHRRADDDFVVAAVHGNADAEAALVGSASSSAAWWRLIDERFALDTGVFFVPAGAVRWSDEVPSHVPDLDAIDEDAGAWHSEDALLATLEASDGTLLGVLSVDEPLSGRRPTTATAATLAAVAVHLAQAIELQDNTRRERRRTIALERLAAVSASALDAPDRIAAMGTLAEAVSDALGFAQVEIASRQSDGRLGTCAVLGASRVLDGIEAVDALELLGGRADGWTATTALSAPGAEHPRGHGPSGWAGEHLLIGMGTDDRQLTGVLRVSAPADRVRADPALIALLRTFAQQAGAVARSDRLRSERDRAQRTAREDRITGLPNRLAVHETLTALGGVGAVLCVGMDDIAQVSSSLGHRAGEGLLRRIADRLAGAAPAGSLVARVGGEDFAVCLPTAGDMAEAAEMIVDCLVSPIDVEGIDVHLSPAVGAAATGDSEDALRCAHAAMTQARRTGRRIVTYDATRDTSRRELELTGALHRAIDGDELTLHFQPLYGLTSGDLLGAEALLRWTYQGHAISPGEFVPLAERSGAIETLGAWVIDQVCAQIAAWERRGLVVPVVGVNVAPRQLARTDLVGIVTAVLARHEVAAERLCVEVTESAITLGGRDAADVLVELDRRGVRCAIDDFGADHSSLGRLATLPVGMVKLDRQFLTDVPDDSQSVRLLDGALNLIAALGLKSVVEGIETPEQARRCAEAGADIGQGFLLGRPQPASAFATLIAGDRPTDVRAAA